MKNNKIAKRPISAGSLLKKIDRFQKERDERKKKTALKNFQKRTWRILILFDATGSMYPYWEETAVILTQLIKRIRTICRDQKFQIKLIAYRDYDHGDKIIEESDWSGRIEYLIEFIEKIECIGGETVEEAVEVALKKANQEKRVDRVVLIGDASPHSQEDALSWARKLKKKATPVFAFYIYRPEDSIADPKVETAFQEIAEYSGGQSAPLENEKEILDMLGLVIVDEIGGKEAVREYLTRHCPVLTSKSGNRALPSGVEVLSRKLLKGGES